MNSDEDSDFVEMLIKGNGEECKVTMNRAGTLAKTTCLQLTNSKKVKILCTKNKKLCKTLSEVRVTLSNPTYKTSYNCNKAATQTEKDICHSKTVSALDYKLGNAYLDMKERISENDFNALQMIQKEWIEERELKCGKLNTFKKREACIWDMYNRRLDSFSLISVSNSRFTYNKSFDEVYEKGTTNERFDLAGYYYYRENDIAKATKLLRKVVGDNNNYEDMFSAFMGLGDMHSDYAKTFNNVTKELLEKNNNSIAMSLLSLGEDPRKVDNVLVKEGYYLNTFAEILLALDYKAILLDPSSSEHDQSYKDKILSFYSECADDGVRRCKVFMGEIYLYGDGVKKDIEKGISLLETADLDDGYYTLGYYFYKEKSIEKSKEYFKLAAEMDHVKSIYNLGVIFQEEKNYKQSIKYLNETIKEDNKFYPAFFELGRMYVEGWGVETDYLKAIDLLTPVFKNSKDKRLMELANKTIAIAELLLGDASKGREAFNWYEKSAMKNNMYAQYNLAKMYFNGDGVEEDEAKVIEWYKNAAKQGHSDAQLYLGLRYWYGKWIEKDQKKALYWMHESAQNGNPQGQFTYGLFLNITDKSESLVWIEKAANQGHKKAMEYLRYEYNKGNKK